MGKRIAKDGRASSILDKAYIQFEEIGPEIVSLPIGGTDIQPISLVHELHDSLTINKRILFRPDSLRQIPFVALVKLIVMQLGHDDRWYLAHFGTLFVRETHPRVYRRRKIQGAYRELYAMNEPTHIFAPLNTNSHLLQAVNGLRAASDKLLHPSTLNGSDIMQLFCKTISIYDNNDGRAEILLLVDAFCMRISEHATSVRQYAVNPAEQRVYILAFATWG